GLFAGADIVFVLLVAKSPAPSVVAEADAVQALYESGPFVNSPLSGVGGADESILQSALFGMNTLGLDINCQPGIVWRMILR
ncbi:MAG: hypothetical protein HC806_10170, partial [Anaerolineae bacterium]|nr:hypothetical protein [Anaerolineae bacterium]